MTLDGPSRLPARERNVVVIIFALVFTTFAEGALLGITPSAIPSVGTLFGVFPASLTWISTVHLLAGAIGTPIFARLGDMYGHRRMLRVAVLVAVIGAVLCALAPDYDVFLLGRILEAAVAAFTPLAIGIARSRMDAAGTRSTVALLIAGLTGGDAVGLIIAAELSSAHPDVRLVLLIPAAFLVIAGVLVFTVVPESTGRVRVRQDWIGYLTLGGGLLLLLLGIANGAKWGWGSAGTIACIVGGLVVLAAWVAIELRVTDPMADLRMAATRRLGPFYVASLVFGCAYLGAQTATSSFMGAAAKYGYGFGLDLTHLAFALLPGAVVSMLGAFAVRSLAYRFSHKGMLYAGCAVTALGYVLMAFLNASLAEFIVANSVAQLGLGFTFGAITLVFTERARRLETGLSVGLMNTTRNIGGSAGNAVFSAVLTSMVFAHTAIPHKSAYMVVWLVCGAASLITIPVVATASGHIMEPAAEEPQASHAPA